MLELIPREKLEHVARKVLKYPLHDAEKDYILTVVMQIVASSDLSEILVFKGGTSIHHCYLEQMRFSEDLDFTSKKKDISLNDIKDLFTEYDIFEIKKEYESKPSLKIERLKYSGILDTPNSIKFEVDRLQSVVMPTVQMQYKNVWGLNFSVNVMNSVEICAEKVRACNDRFRYRDFYDLYMMANKLGLNIENSIKLIPKKEIRKTINKQNLLRNLELSLNEVSEKGDTVVYSESVQVVELRNFFKSMKLSSYEPNVD
ncbi:MAG: nucleotidyl transferase AbiEii/AbiGii toxin family protein [Patescibacteria group bacterium]|nr:nucleotidyl transferase AbiEii/AbiGii toxin family protein [Patescibacteria group bacterium]